MKCNPQPGNRRLLATLCSPSAIQVLNPSVLHVRKICRPSVLQVLPRHFEILTLNNAPR
jgi:hypothetical protein